MLGLMLIQLVKEHKESCDSEDCGVSTFAFYKLFKQLMGRDGTEEEFSVFM